MTDPVTAAVQEALTRLGAPAGTPLPDTSALARVLPDQPQWTPTHYLLIEELALRHWLNHAAGQVVPIHT